MTDLIEAVLQVAGIAILSLGGLAIHRLADWLRLRADDQVRGYLTAALERAVEYGQAEARRRLGAGARGAEPNLAAELALEYAMARVPDALARFGVDTAGLDQMIRARLPSPKPAATRFD